MHENLILHKQLTEVKRKKNLQYEILAKPMCAWKDHRQTSALVKLAIAGFTNSKSWMVKWRHSFPVVFRS